MKNILTDIKLFFGLIWLSLFRDDSTLTDGPFDGRFEDLDDNQ